MSDYTLALFILLGIVFVGSFTTTCVKLICARDIKVAEINAKCCDD